MRENEGRVILVSSLVSTLSKRGRVLGGCFAFVAAREWEAGGRIIHICQQPTFSIYGSGQSGPPTVRGPTVQGLFSGV